MHKGSTIASVPGVGKILALTIKLETGDIHRLAKVGNFASYARCVESRHISNGKKKGEGNGKCGNKYLAWAFVEAANFAIRYQRTDQAVLTTQKGQDQWNSGDQGDRSQTGARLLSHDA